MTHAPPSRPHRRLHRHASTLESAGLPKHRKRSKRKGPPRQAAPRPTVKHGGHENVVPRAVDERHMPLEFHLSGLKARHLQGRGGRGEAVGCGQGGWGATPHERQARPGQAGGAGGARVGRSRAAAERLPPPLPRSLSPGDPPLSSSAPVAPRTWGCPPCLSRRRGSRRGAGTWGRRTCDSRRSRARISRHWQQGHRPAMPLQPPMWGPGPSAWQATA